MPQTNAGRTKLFTSLVFKLGHYLNFDLFVCHLRRDRLRRLRLHFSRGLAGTFARGTPLCGSRGNTRD